MCVSNIEPKYGHAIHRCQNLCLMNLLHTFISSLKEYGAGGFIFKFGYTAGSKNLLKSLFHFFSLWFHRFQYWKKNQQYRWKQIKRLVFLISRKTRTDKKALKVNHRKMEKSKIPLLFFWLWFHFSFFCESFFIFGLPFI